MLVARAELLGGVDAAASAANTKILAHARGDWCGPEHGVHRREVGHGKLSDSLDRRAEASLLGGVGQIEELHLVRGAEETPTPGN